MVLASIVVLLTGLEMFYGLFLLVGESKNRGYLEIIVQIFADFSLFPCVSTHIVLEGSRAQNTPSTTCADGASYKEKAIFERKLYYLSHESS